MIAVILLSATCYIAYRNLSSIVSTVQVDFKPELRIVSIRDISHDLETADNCIRIYSITRDTSDLRPYYSKVNGIDEKVTRLKVECSEDSIMLNQVDTISKLIEENIVIWNELLYTINNDNAAEILKQLSIQINTAPASKEEQGILRRVFARNSQYLSDQEALISNIQKIQEQRKITSLSMMAQESQLAENSSRIKEKFYDLMARMEAQVSRQEMERGEAANRIAEKTYIWLIIFSISGGMLVLLVLFIVIRYIRKAGAYQVALEKSKTETENLARTKEIFMANISHEIRTPVTAISGFTEQLLHETFDENILRSLKIIKSSSDHLSKIIDNILDLSKLQNGKMMLEKVHFNIVRVLEEVYGIFKQQAQKNDIQLDFSIAPGTPPILQGDPYRLRQILINLVANAVKFTEHGSVSFSAEGITSGSGEVELVLKVIDTGIGIDQDKLDFIFEDFTQAEMSTSRKYGGTGLGLSIVKKLVDLHNGSIECESRKNHGTKITCHLPMLTGREENLKRDVTIPVTIPEDLKKLKVLIVDDEEYNRLLFKKIMDRWQIDCDVASNGMEAIEILKERKYDLLFMDVRMPGLDGFKATQFIRNEMKIGENEMPVICISAVSPEEDKTKYRQAGMNSVLRKPFTEDMLLTTMLAARQNVKQILIKDTPEAVEKVQNSRHKINLDNLYHISGGDEKFVKQMLESFGNSTDRGLKEMLEACLSEQPDHISGIAHKLLPPCRHLGAMDLYDILEKIEKNDSRTNTGPEIEMLVRKAIAEFEEVNKLLNEHISKIN